MKLKKTTPRHKKYRAIIDLSKITEGVYFDKIWLVLDRFYKSMNPIVIISQNIVASMPYL
jgi:hypothetical protein